MLFVDAHCDTVTEALDRNLDLYRNDLHIDLERMIEEGNCVQFFAAFIHPAVYKGNELLRLIRILDFVQQQAELYKNYISICRNSREICDALSMNRIAAIISVENGGVLAGDLAVLRMLYRLGVRSVSLTWNYSNEMAGGVRDGSGGTGLTALGREAVAEMNRLGILADVSHLSEKSFWDVLETSKAPVIASHSNAKAVCGNPRNLDDKQLLALKTAGGVSGINLYPDFLTENGSTASIEDIIRHIEHIAALTGENHIGLGSDFDGADRLPSGIGGVQDRWKIIDRLITLNYSQSFIEKLCGGNFLRVIERVMN